MGLIDRLLGIYKQQPRSLSLNNNADFSRQESSQSDRMLQSFRDRLARRKSKTSLFSSDLSTNEYFLTRESGCEPIGVVMGSSFYQVGFYRNLWGYRGRTGEVEPLTHAQLAARELAVSRLQQEAAILGAHGVIGVRLQQRQKGWGIGMVEFIAIGTVIRIPGFSTTDKPFTSDLSGQEFWQLRQAGYLPKGLVFGVCSYYVHSDRTTRQLMNQSFWSRLFGRGRRNQEIAQLTQGFQDARELAILRLTTDIQKVGATGAVGMQIEMSEEVIIYQPRSFLGCFWQLFVTGLLTAIFISAFTGNTALLTLIYPFISAILAFISAHFSSIPIAITILAIGQSVWNGWSNPGPNRDLLTHFIATGTAISADKIPSTNPVSKTLFFQHLSAKTL